MVSGKSSEYHLSVFVRAYGSTDLRARFRSKGIGSSVIPGVVQDIKLAVDRVAGQFLIRAQSLVQCHARLDATVLAYRYNEHSGILRPDCREKALATLAVRILQGVVSHLYNCCTLILRLQRITVLRRSILCMFFHRNDIAAFQLYHFHMEIRLQDGISHAVLREPVTERIQTEILALLKAQISLLIYIEIDVAGIVCILRKILHYSIPVRLLSDIHIRASHLDGCLRGAGRPEHTIGHSITVRRIRYPEEPGLILPGLKGICLGITVYHGGSVRNHIVMYNIIGVMTGFENEIILSIFIGVRIRNRDLHIRSQRHRQVNQKIAPSDSSCTGIFRIFTLICFHRNRLIGIGIVLHCDKCLRTGISYRIAENSLTLQSGLRYNIQIFYCIVCSISPSGRSPAVECHHVKIVAIRQLTSCDLNLYAADEGCTVITFQNIVTGNQTNIVTASHRRLTLQKVVRFSGIRYGVQLQTGHRGTQHQLCIHRVQYLYGKLCRSSNYISS